ncbi:hypothetical protein [Streptomyces sp. OP7]|uniref:hypothetical protein n=1 Tax=Streptomyces sp. OP7 TaxID=3142462 RepID=UPI0032E8F0E9
MCFADTRGSQVEIVQRVEAVRELGDPIAVWPAVFHALWSGVLRVRLDEPLHERAVVSVARQEADAA